MISESNPQTPRTNANCDVDARMRLRTHFPHFNCCGGDGDDCELLHAANFAYDLRMHRVDGVDVAQEMERY